MSLSSSRAVALLAAVGVAACGSDREAPRYAPQVRSYFVAADEVEWDYAPSGANGITGLPFGPAEDVFVATGPSRIGRVYRKSLYRGYTDATFTQLAPVAAEWAHLGTLGPLIRGVVGDTLRVTFKNNTAFPATMHPHGVFYAKDSEGAPYADGTSGADLADTVPPGGTHVYEWKVPERAGPGPADGSSVIWMYHSHADEVADTNAGLVGPMIVTAAARARADGTPDDVDREFVNLFTVYDENASPHLAANVANHAGDPATVVLEDPDFEESNLMHAMNGYVYGNLPGLVMRNGDRVRWYLIGMGTEVDLHTPHWHGQSVVALGMRTDMVELLPASMKIADMVVDNPGTWLYHCHVNDHITAGMIATFRVDP